MTTLRNSLKLAYYAIFWNSFYTHKTYADQFDAILSDAKIPTPDYVLRMRAKTDTKIFKYSDILAENDIKWDIYIKLMTIIEAFENILNPYQKWLTRNVR